MKNNTTTNIGKFYDFIKYKYYSFLWKLRTIRFRILGYLDDCTKVKKFWYIPTQVSYLEDACNFYAGHIKELENLLATKDHKIDLLLEEVIALKEYHEKLDERTATRRAYADYCDYNLNDTEESESYRLFLNKCPPQFLTKDENSDWFDYAHDDYVTGDPISRMNHLDLANHSLDKLTKRGLYEKKKY